MTIVTALLLVPVATLSIMLFVMIRSIRIERRKHQERMNSIRAGKSLRQHLSRRSNRKAA